MKVKIYALTEVEVAYIRVDTYVVFWEDACVNGVQDDNDTPSMPCVDSEGYYWQPLINVETGQIENWEKGITANTRYKVCDEFKCEFLNEKKEVLKSYDGYVPEFMYPNGDGWGDYIKLIIDEEGYIKGWNKDLVSKFLKEND